jgi:hypothetical protein
MPREERALGNGLVNVGEEQHDVDEALARGALRRATFERSVDADAAFTPRDARASALV